MSADAPARQGGILSLHSPSVVVMHYYENTGDVCVRGHPISSQVVKSAAFGGQQLESRTGPSCWVADCPGNQH